MNTPFTPLSNLHQSQPPKSPALIDIFKHVYSFLEVLPFCAVSFVLCLHWNQFASLFGAGDEKPRFALRPKQSPLPKSYLLGFLGAVALNGTAYGEEWTRCGRVQQHGLTGVDTPEAARKLYASERKPVLPKSGTSADISQGGWKGPLSVA